MDTIKIIKEKYNLLAKTLNEKQRRFWAWAEAIVLWNWGIEKVHKATWIAKNTIKRWKKELESWAEIVSSNNIRKWWGWRKKEINKNPKISEEIKKIMDENTAWDPMSLLKRTSKSLRKISEELESKWYKVWYDIVWRVLKWMWYSLQSNRKMLEWWNHKDRDAQFKFIWKKAKEFQNKWYAVLSVDTKKKELVWNFKNFWKERAKKWEAKIVNVYDFPSDADWKVSPYWIYDIVENEWFVNVWTSSDTSEFAVESIRKRWNTMWKKYLWKKIYINADWWGSNWYRVRLWKFELQKLANERNTEFHVSHFPPWTSKRNKIEHKMFSFISKNRRWKPLVSLETVVNLIWSTKTKKWLEIICELDTNKYEKWIKISDKEFKKVNLKKDNFHWEWNYVIWPIND